MNYFTTIVLALVSFYILLLIIVFSFQRNLLYHPSVDNYLNDQGINEPTEIEKVKITTIDNIDLVAWFYNKNIEKFQSPQNTATHYKSKATLKYECKNSYSRR